MSIKKSYQRQQKTIDKVAEGNYTVTIDNKPNKETLIIRTRTNYRKEAQPMSEKAQNAFEKLSENISKVPEAKKEYLLGLADGIALMVEQEEQKEVLNGSEQCI